MVYSYGEEISYDYQLIMPGDFSDLQAFSCGNKKLDYFIHNELISNGKVNVEESLPFKVIDTSTGKIIGVVSLAASGIIFQVDNYIQVLPSIKIDVFAIDKEYQKLHYNQESKESDDPDEHFYFSDDVMGTFISHCRNIAEKKAVAHYIVLYADKDAKRFYERNMFEDFSKFMVKEKNMEIEANDPMYMKID